MTQAERSNPFPGPQPYRAEDHRRFFGRDDAIRRLSNHILAHACTILFGPSGCGKSSLMQAGVIPRLDEQYGFRSVRVDGWPAGAAPLAWLSSAVAEALEVQVPPGGEDGIKALQEAIRFAYRRSDRPVLIFIDQLEQLFYPNKDRADVDAFFKALSRLVQTPIRGLQLVLALREDYLGRFRDGTRAMNELWQHSFRLGPFTAEEMADAVCRIAATGVPPQSWPMKQILSLMIQVRISGQVPGEKAEIQAAFAQIVCRALWDERTAVGASPGALGAVHAEAILHRHLGATLDSLGPLKADTLRLLEEYLIDAYGHRTLLIEGEARQVLPSESETFILDTLERGGILRAEEHQGRRYFELGHDWIAGKVFELRREREAQAEKAKVRDALAKRMTWIGLIAVLIMALSLAGFMWVNSSRLEKTVADRDAAVEKSDRANRQLESANKQLTQANEDIKNAKKTAEDSAHRIRASQKLKMELLYEDKALRKKAFSRAVQNRSLVFCRSEFRRGSTWEVRFFVSRESLRESRPIAAITYFMDHPTFLQKLYGSSPDTDFAMTYEGWGYPQTFTAVIEYADVEQMPEVAVIEATRLQCGERAPGAR
jgi:energy-coupling factor transporter ATP-binding protein EcfA2